MTLANDLVESAIAVLYQIADEAHRRGDGELELIALESVLRIRGNAGAPREGAADTN